MKLLRRCFWLFAILLFVSHSSHAGIRMPGNYAGTVIFDRWGGCTLYSGIYVMYISEKIKKQFLPYKNDAIQILATDVYQPINPGDGLIKKFEYIGPAKPPPTWINETSLLITTSLAFKNGEQPSIEIKVTNTGSGDLRIYSKQLAPTLLTKSSGKSILNPSDGPSFALVTRQDFWIGGDETPRWHSSGVEDEKSYEWTIEKSHALPKYFSLKPRESRQIKIYFNLPEGEYEFLCGYGGGVHEYKCVTSNLTPFDVDKEGKGKVVTSNKSDAKE